MSEPEAGWPPDDAERRQGAAAIAPPPERVPPARSAGLFTPAPDNSLFTPVVEPGPWAEAPPGGYDDLLPRASPGAGPPGTDPGPWGETARAEPLRLGSLEPEWPIGSSYRESPPPASGYSDPERAVGTYDRLDPVPPAWSDPSPPTWSDPSPDAWRDPSPPVWREAGRPPASGPGTAPRSPYQDEAGRAPFGGGSQSRPYGQQDWEQSWNGAQINVLGGNGLGGNGTANGVANGVASRASFGATVDSADYSPSNDGRAANGQIADNGLIAPAGWGAASGHPEGEGQGSAGWYEMSEGTVLAQEAPGALKDSHDGAPGNKPAEPPEALRRQRPDGARRRRLTGSLPRIAKAKASGSTVTGTPASGAAVAGTVVSEAAHGAAVNGYANGTAVNGYANGAAVNGYANGAAVNGYANGAAVNGYANGAAVNGYANGAAVNGYANGAAVNGYANAAPPVAPPLQRRSERKAPVYVPTAQHASPEAPAPATAAPVTRRALRPRKRASTPLGTAVGAVAEIAIVLSMALVLSLVIKTFLVQAFFIPSQSMENTLLIGDRVLVSKLTPGPFTLQHGDVIVFQDPGGWLQTKTPQQPGALRGALSGVLTFVGLLPQDSGEHLIKRVIGLPGDTVVCCDKTGHLTVNGVSITEPYLKPGVAPSNQAFKVTVKAGNLWVMGDNRIESADSRAHREINDGQVPEKDVVGKAFVVVWPFGRIGGVTSPHEVFARVPTVAAKP